MDETKLRQLERQYKLRVKTGCDTCRLRRVKCDETKPECLRCTKSGRNCGGYKHVTKFRSNSPSAAASYRNPSFLVVPQKTRPTSVPRSPVRSVSPESTECRSFHYFQTHTLPQWTEYFDSGIWNIMILQLSHVEPAIKHGVLALSALHERFEKTKPMLQSGTHDFAFAQYMAAVKHSNELLTAHREGRVDVEKVLVACIIFTCYENLAGNYVAANMHLRNGIRILNQHRLGTGTRPQAEPIADILFRFDFQAMAFSDNASPYEYSLDNPPEYPIIPLVYTSVSDARKDLIDLLRCMMWISGIVNVDPGAMQNPTWLLLYTQFMASFSAWEMTFEQYQHMMLLTEQVNTKIHSGITLLQIYGTMARIIVSAGSTSPINGELSWDPLLPSFTRILDLAESLPIQTQTTSRARSVSSSSTSSTSPPYISPIPSPFQLSRSLANTPSPPAFPSTPSFFPDLHPTPPPTHSSGPQTPAKPRPSFTPSFELSPILPLFLTTCRCRDPVVRRRALALLFSCRRREGVWDSHGAGLVALEVLKLEEGLPESVSPGPDHWVPLSARVRDAGQVGEARRIKDVFVRVDMEKRRIEGVFVGGVGGEVRKNVKF
ncbi:hypothetical protein M011DRAFT_56878 [Sporormia fimetaria CBS 119925]|uniref:Zn(2)-C6 fungal-type domain-containing protein n=1 Tax=Sporormia fimetaria CBS 119925 TaxID=1340428 RepID=A0A6A6VCN7_9PLEO|nr:hypothetical protein M011DRAFT_56878 [Sporormia fimetaria CBS 119925]